MANVIICCCLIVALLGGFGGCCCCWCCCFLLPLLHMAHHRHCIHACIRTPEITYMETHTHMYRQYTSHRCTHGCTAELRPKRFEQGISVDMLNVLSCVFYYFVLSLSFPFDVCAFDPSKRFWEPFTSKYDTHLLPNTTHAHTHKPIQSKPRESAPFSLVREIRFETTSAVIIKRYK